MNRNQKGDETDFPEERSNETDQPVGAAHRSADEKFSNFVVDVRDRTTAPSRQAPVEEDAKRQNTPLRCGGLPPASSLADFFSDKNIIGQLCARRMKLAARRYEKHFFASMLNGAVVPMIGSDEAPLLPGRKQWRHCRPYESQRNGGSKQPNHQALLDATLRLRKRNPSMAWNKNLEIKIAALTSRVFGPDFTFAKPNIRPQPKKDNAYRAIVAFQDDDKMIGSLTAQYFRRQLDPLFHDCSLAFRLRNQGDPRMRAMEQIDALRQMHNGSPIYIAEADIMGFFDTVDHGILWERMEALVNAGNLALDPKALAVLRAYLDVYSFPCNVLGAMNELRAKMGAHAHFAWPLEQLRAFHRDPLTSRVGIPQGGALSDVMVNILLHFADAAVEQFRSEGNDLLYLRFCDDVIFLSPSREVIVRAFEIYLEQLRLLKLAVHQPISLPPYVEKARPQYWATKSKAPFSWGFDIDQGQIPWISFLGYELRRDGFLRVRRSSIEKQKKKVTSIVGHAVRYLDQAILTGTNHSFRVSIQSFVNKVLGKVIATSVGRVTIGKEVAGPRPRTFASGFQFLAGKMFPLKMFREHDRHRERNIRRLMRRACKVPAQKVKSSTRRIRIPQFFGRPFSYLSQFYFPSKKHMRNRRSKISA